jgi:hypothetical protein
MEIHQNGLELFKTCIEDMPEITCISGLAFSWQKTRLP